MSEFDVRAIRPDDFATARAVADDWMGREVGLVMHRLFFDQLGSHGVWVTHEGELVGFLLGLLSDREPDLAYIHFHVVDPGRRKMGIGSLLYRAFGERAAERGCRRVRALAPLWNTGSIAFHEHLGFVGREERDYVGPGQHRIVFERRLPIADSDDGA